MLLAEGDRDAYRRQQAALEREKEIMKDVPGWEVNILFVHVSVAGFAEMLLVPQKAGKSVYHDKKHVPRESVVVL